MLIDTSYFTPGLGLDIAGLSSPHVKARVERFVDDLEPEFLEKALGPLLATDFTTGYGTTPTAAEWSAIAENLQKALACYVYYEYMGDKATVTTTLGEAKPKAQNSEMKSGVDKQRRAWNRMRDYLLEVYEVLDKGHSSYTNWIPSWRHGRRLGGRFYRNELLGINTSGVL